MFFIIGPVLINPFNGKKKHKDANVALMDQIRSGSRTLAWWGERGEGRGGAACYWWSSRHMS